MPRVAVYARVSSEDQAERGTIENQIDFARKYVELHHINVVEWYKDDGVTGTIPLESRPEGRRLIADAKAHKFDLLLIYRLDRLGRSARVILNAVHELEQLEIKIRSMTEPFDTGDPSGRFLLTILAGVADLERETILERMTYGANRAASEGKWLGGIVPYGYRVSKDGFLEINDDPLPGIGMSEADVVRLIYRLVSREGLSTIKVADYLNAVGIPPSYVKDGRQVRRGKRKVNTAGIWRPSRVRNMIVNTTYKGVHYYGKRSNKKRDLIVREVPAIVSEEVWDKAQKVLRDNQLEALKNSKRRRYLLRGLIKCGICGLTYSGVAYPSSRRENKAFYVCNGKRTYRGPMQGECTSKNIPAEWIETHVWSEIMSFISDPGEILSELTAMTMEKARDREAMESEKSRLVEAINAKEAEKQSILDLYRKKIITSSDVERQFSKIEAERKILEEHVKELDRRISAEKASMGRFDEIELLFSDLRSKLQGEIRFETKREVIRALVDKIVVHTENDPYGRKRAVASVYYTFLKPKDVIFTDTRGDNNLGVTLERRAQLQTPSRRKPRDSFQE